MNWGGGAGVAAAPSGLTGRCQGRADGRLTMEGPRRLGDRLSSCLRRNDGRDLGHMRVGVWAGQAGSVVRRECL